MRLIKIGLASLNPTVGKFRGNLVAALAAAKELTEAEKCTVICLPEQSLPGYTGEDYVHWQGFVDAQWDALLQFAETTYSFAGIRPVYVVGLTVSYNGSLFNCAAVVCDGKILGVVPKEKLPTYNVFYERRTTSPGLVAKTGTVHCAHPNASNSLEPIPFGDLIFQFPFGIMAVEICEDIWSPRGPMSRRCFSGAELVVNISASPFRAGVVQTRKEMISTRASDNCATVVYINQFGGNDALVHDGGGYVNQGGRMVHVAPRKRVSLSTVVVDLDRTARQRRENMTWQTDADDFLLTHDPVKRVVETRSPQTIGTHYRYPVPKTGPNGELPNCFVPDSRWPIDPQIEYFEDLFDIMVIGLTGYFEKVGVFKRIGIALSGGKDSTLSLLVAHRFAQNKFAHLPEEARAAAIKDFIHCISFPTHFNSKEGRDAARELCETLGVTYMEAPIDQQVSSMNTLMQATLGPGGKITSVALQNVQARIRGTAMWNWSNCNDGLFMYTGNMTEKAEGWTTLGGDLEGGFGVLGNLPRTAQVPMMRYLNERYYDSSKVLGLIIDTPPSPELEESQVTEEQVMPFPIADACYYYFVGEKMMPAEVLVVLRQMFSIEQLKEMHPDYQPRMLAGWVCKFVKMLRAAIVKWDQGAKTVHLGSLDLDVKRALQLPIATSEEWLRLDTIEEDATQLERI
jgi:NAD+ synthase (glutamine-hydrolysing)